MFFLSMLICILLSWDYFLDTGKIKVSLNNNHIVFLEIWNAWSTYLVTVVQKAVEKAYFNIAQPGKSARHFANQFAEHYDKYTLSMKCAAHLTSTLSPLKVLRNLTTVSQIIYTISQLCL